MKKYLLLALVALFSASCATLQIKKYPHITSEGVQNQCEAQESWNLGGISANAYVGVYEDCLNIENILVIAISVDELIDVRRHSLKLIELRFMEFMNTRKDGDQTLKWSIKKIKEEATNKWNVHFYELAYKKLECSGPTCKRN